jgi:hypothetical protein
MLPIKWKHKIQLKIFQIQSDVMNSEPCTETGIYFVSFHLKSFKLIIIHTYCPRHTYFLQYLHFIMSAKEVLRKIFRRQKPIPLACSVNIENEPGHVHTGACFLDIQPLTIVELLLVLCLSKFLLIFKRFESC